MIRPERDPHYCLGREHGRDGLEPYTFADAENQRRYLEGYGRGKILRAALVAGAPYQNLASLGQHVTPGIQQCGPRGRP